MGKNYPEVIASSMSKYLKNPLNLDTKKDLKTACR